jgi:hypothetical protein
MGSLNYKCQICNTPKDIENAIYDAIQSENFTHLILAKNEPDDANSHFDLYAFCGELKAGQLKETI